MEGIEAWPFGVSFLVGQKNSEYGALRAVPMIRLYLYASSMPFGDLFADPEPESCSHVLLGGEKGLKDSLQVLRRDARTVVFYFETDRLSISQLYGRRVYFQRSADGCGIDGVGDDVGYELLYLAS